MKSWISWYSYIWKVFDWDWPPFNWLCFKWSMTKEFNQMRTLTCCFRSLNASTRLVSDAVMSLILRSRDSTRFSKLGSCSGGKSTVVLFTSSTGLTGFLPSFTSMLPLVSWLESVSWGSWSSTIVRLKRRLSTWLLKVGVLSSAIQWADRYNTQTQSHS